MSLSFSGIQSLWRRDEEFPLTLRVNHKLPHTRKIAGKTVAFSLEWHSVDDDRAAMLKRACDDSEGAYGVVMKSAHDHEANPSGVDSETVIGVAAKTPKVKSWACAASIAATLYDTALIVLRLDEDRYWLLALCNALPIPGKDWVGSEMEVSAIANDLLAAFDFECLGDREFWDRRNLDLEASSSSKSLTLDELLTADRVHSAPVLRVYRNHHTPKLVIAAALLAVIALGNGFGAQALDWVKNTFTEQGERDRLVALTQQVTAENAQSAQHFNRIASNYPLDHWIERLGSTLDRLRLTARGWNLTKLECGAGLPYCLATWSNTGKGTYAGLKQSISGVGELSVEAPQTVKQTVPIEPYQPHTFSDLEVVSRVEALPSQEELLVNHFSLLQALTIIPGVTAGMDIKSQKTIGYPLNLPSNFPLPRIQPFQLGQWNLEGNGLRELMGSLQKMDPQVFFGESLTLTISITDAGVVNTHWVVKGKYVSKTS